MDLAVKWRFFRHLLSGGNDPDAERVYRWHIEERSGARMRAGLATDRWKQSSDDYVRSARWLVLSMREDGFIPFFAVPIDPNGEMLDGSHRVACAIACEAPAVYVERHTRMAWAPPWDLAWFEDRGMRPDDLARMKADWKEMNAAGNHC